MPAELALDGKEYVATVDYERREPRHTWVATRISEIEKGGKQPPKVLEEPRVAAGPPPTGAQTSGVDTSFDGVEAHPSR
jgi:hypothetical protein